MWVLKIKYWHEGSLTIPLAQKYNITMLGFPFNRFEKNGYVHLTSAHVILGTEENRKAYFEEIKSNPKYEHLEIEGNMAIYSIKARKDETHLQMYLSPELIWLKPIVVKPDGFQYLEIGALDKKVLTDFLKIAQKWVEIKLQKISRKKVRDFYVPHVMPDITEKQKKAITIAYRNGYYDYPKKTDIKRLASISKCSPSTFQEHLRKAEQKLIPFFLENIIHEGK